MVPALSVSFELPVSKQEMQAQSVSMPRQVLDSFSCFILCILLDINEGCLIMDQDFRSPLLGSDQYSQRLQVTSFKLQVNALLFPSFF